MSPANLCFVFEEWEYDEETNSAEESKQGKGNTEEEVKAETAAAYDKVGETAHFEGDMKKAHKVMAALDYSEEEIAIAGPDAYNF